MKKAYFAGGCFWCITPCFAKLEGVEKVVSGYCGGKESNPSYEEVKKQQTGHRETIMVQYDDPVAFESLLEVFLDNIDPFDAGGQYIDRGHSYTLAIYYQNDEEKEIASRRIRKLEEESGKKTHIALEPLEIFYDAEEYHQDYYLKNPDAFEKELIESGRKK